MKYVYIVKHRIDNRWLCNGAGVDYDIYDVIKTIKIFKNRKDAVAFVKLAWTFGKEYYIERNAIE